MTGYPRRWYSATDFSTPPRRMTGSGRAAMSFSPFTAAKGAKIRSYVSSAPPAQCPIPHSSKTVPAGASGLHRLGSSPPKLRGSSAVRKSKSKYSAGSFAPVSCSKRRWIAVVNPSDPPISRVNGIHCGEAPETRRDRFSRGVMSGSKATRLQRNRVQPDSNGRPTA